MAAAERTCATCGNGFVGRAGARFCSSRCRQRARRSRAGGKCDSAVVTVVPRLVGGPGAGTADSAAGSAHCAEAVAVLSGLDAELAENSEELGQQLAWSAAERRLRE